MRRTILALALALCALSAAGQNLGTSPVNFKTISGTSSPSDTCSATSYNGAIEINTTPTAYQCTNATGSFAWNVLGSTATGTITGVTAGAGLSGGGSSGSVTLAVTPVNTVVDTSTPVTVSTTKPAEFHFNENATAATAITYDLPTAAAGKQFCFANAYNGSAANTGTLELLTSASGQFIVFTDGTLSATGGYVISGGAAADAACLVGIDSTHWFLYVQAGTWTKH